MCSQHSYEAEAIYCSGLVCSNMLPKATQAKTQIDVLQSKLQVGRDIISADQVPVPDCGYPVQSGLGAPGKSINPQFMMESSKNIKYDSLDLHILLLRGKKKSTRSEENTLGNSLGKPGRVMLHL